MWSRTRTQLVRSLFGNRPAQRVKPSRAEPVQVHIMGSNSLDIVHARDISITGIGVFLGHRDASCQLAAGVELVITLPGERSFQASGRVVHVTQDLGGDYFGVEFVELARAGRDSIARYVDARARASAP